MRVLSLKQIMPTLAWVNNWWYALWYAAEPPSLDEGSIRAYSGHQLDSGHPIWAPKPASMVHLAKSRKSTVSRETRPRSRRP